MRNKHYVTAYMFFDSRIMLKYPHVLNQKSQGQSA